MVLYILLLSSFLWREAFFNLPYLPFISYMDIIPGWIYSHILLPVYIISGIFALIGYKFRLALMVFGGILIFSIVSSMPIFSNSLLFAGVIIFLSGLCPDHRYIFNIQVALLYLGAAINKLWDIDWWNGQFFHTLATYRHPMPLYELLQLYFENLRLAQILGIFTMLTELALAVLFLFKSKTKLAVIIGLVFHIGILFLTKGSLSLSFLFIMSCAYIILLKPIRASFTLKSLGLQNIKISGIYLVYAYFIILLGLLLSPIVLSRL